MKHVCEIAGEIDLQETVETITDGEVEATIASTQCPYCGQVKAEMVDFKTRDEEEGA